MTYFREHVAADYLSGGFDGDRIAAQVAGFEKNSLLLDLPGLDPVRWARPRRPRRPR